MLTEHLVARSDARAPRDPETGLLEGAEPRDLGPKDAPGAVLLVHGFLGAGQNFGELPEALAEHGWRARAMLLPGHGTSPRDLETVDADELVDAVFAEAQALANEHGNVVLIGHSMGGALCTLAAAQGHADGLVLVAPYFEVTHRWYYILPPEQWIRIGSPIVRWVYKGQMLIQVNRPEAKDKILSYEWAPTRAGRTLAELGERARASECLDRVTCPVLLLHSHGDEASSPEAAEKAWEGMASTDKRIAWFDRSNHHLFFDYDREEVVAEILTFLDQHFDTDN